QPGSDWMRLRPGGDVHLSTAKERILRAFNEFEACLDSLDAERFTENQDNDIIKTGSDLNDRGIDSLRVWAADARDGMTNGYTRVEDWDGNGSTPPTALRVRPGALFDHPIDDWKSLLPPYSFDLVRRPWGEDYLSEHASPVISVVVPETGAYTASIY